MSNLQRTSPCMFLLLNAAMQSQGQVWIYDILCDVIDLKVQGHSHGALPTSLPGDGGAPA